MRAEVVFEFPFVDVKTVLGYRDGIRGLIENVRELENGSEKDSN